VLTATGRIEPRARARSQVSVFGEPRLAEFDMLGDVGGRQGDRGAPARLCAPYGQRSVVVGVGDFPPVTVFHPAPPQGQTALVLASDDDIAAGGLVAVVQAGAIECDGACQDPVGAGAGVEFGDGSRVSAISTDVFPAARSVRQAW